MSLLIQNGTVVLADRTFAADVLIEGELVKEVRAGIPPNAADTIIDASGMLLLPGGIDVHTHLDMPFGGTTSSDDYLTGTRAAAYGGTTTIVDFAIQARGTKMRDALDTWWGKAEGKACIDYGLHMIVTDLGTSGLDEVMHPEEGAVEPELFCGDSEVDRLEQRILRGARQRTGNWLPVPKRQEPDLLFHVRSNLQTQGGYSGSARPINANV